MLKPHYRVVILVLASHDQQIYRNCRRVWQAYLNLHPSIKIFMVYGHTGPSPEERQPYDLVYDDIKENHIPGMAQKTLRAMEHIDKICTFNFFIRTNSTTFWSFSHLLAHLNTLPATLCYSGDGPFLNEYLSGTDTIVNGYMVKQFIENRQHLNYEIHEDQAMGRIFHGILGAPFLPNRIHFMESFSSINPTPIRKSIYDGINKGADHYRVKNTKSKDGRERTDFAVYAELLQIIYGVSIPPIPYMKSGKQEHSRKHFREIVAAIWSKMKNEKRKV